MVESATSFKIRNEATCRWREGLSDGVRGGVGWVGRKGCRDTTIIIILFRGCKRHSNYLAIRNCETKGKLDDLIREERVGGKRVRGRSVEGLCRVLNLITAISRRLCVPNILNYSGVPRMTKRSSFKQKSGSFDL